MHVGLVIAGDIDTGSGGFYYDRRLRDRLLERGHEVTVVSIPWRSYSGQLLENAGGIGRDLQRRGFDIVVEDGLAHPSLLRANRRLDGPVVALCHMLKTVAAGRSVRPLVRAVERRFLNGVDAAIYNSEATRAVGESLSGPDTAAVVPPGGDRFGSTVTASDVRERAQSSPLEVRFVGNVVERKGLDTLIRGIAPLDADWRLTVVGDTSVDPAYAASARSTVREGGIAGRVRFTGRLSDSAVEQQLRTAHVLAVPSRYEPFGMAHLEAMAFGCVPIATANGGPSEFIDDGESGFIIEPNDPGAITDRLRRVADRDRLAALGVAALDVFERQPGWTETLDNAVDFLEERCPAT